MQTIPILLTVDRPDPETLLRLTGLAQLENNPDLIWVLPPEDKLSIGIEAVHVLQRDLSLKPFGETQQVAVISPAHLLTVPAQQAMLKLLEEPPEDTLIILSTSLPQKLLPTLRSRTNLIRATGENLGSRKEYLALTQLSVSSALKKSDEWSKVREEAVGRLRSLALEVRELYLTDPNQKLLKHERSILACIDHLERNINAKLALDHLFFELSGHSLPAH